MVHLAKELALILLLSLLVPILGTARGSASATYSGAPHYHDPSEHHHATGAATPPGGGNSADYRNPSAELFGGLLFYFPLALVLLIIASLVFYLAITDRKRRDFSKDSPQAQRWDSGIPALRPQADSYLLSLYVLKRIFKRACVAIESVEGKAADIFANIRL